MIRIIFLFIVLGAGLFVGTQYTGQQGYVLISIANKTIEMSVTTLVIFVIAALAVLFFLEYLFKKLMYAGTSTFNYFSVRKMRRSRRFTNEGILKLLEGDWKQAEKKVTRWASYHDMPLLCYLVASEAALGQGDKEKCQHYLDLASQQKNSELAVQLTRAKQAIREENYQIAQSTLETLAISHPSHKVVQDLLKTTYIKQNQWKPLVELLPSLKKSKLIDDSEKSELELRAVCGQMHDIAGQQGSEGLVTYWNSLTKKMRQQSHLIQCFVKLLISRKADDKAFTVIKESTKKQHINELYELIPSLNLADRHPAIVLLEQVISKTEKNASVHSSLGQLYLRESRWQDAQKQFEAALTLRPDVSDYAYLADALENQNMTKAAGEVSRKALTLVS
ncbi:heme biosynthesis protein HemY [Vibrio hippocampi]|uniref:Protein HemY n=1 Tax=Vibrio hippocampi TaxID=654686 RepID=A0ABM8ZKP0_9VIBR|nr:heme biosynthesis HemY N-terminal domain-containing protein [Vibrio hippocampi]CAH0527401.1 Protein HemY [Vibrio hippocampi]